MFMNARMANAAATAVTSLLLAMPAQSASVSYILDQSNSLADGVDYLKVTMSDGTDGAVDFKVEMLPALSGQASAHLGIQAFAFNIVGGTATEARNISGLPDGWRARNGGRMDGFGLFDIKLQGPGWSRQTELDFSITGVSLDTLLSYVDLSTGQAAEGQVDFAARVNGFASNPTSRNGGINQNYLLEIVNTNCDTGGHHDGGDDNCDQNFRFGEDDCGGGHKVGGYFGGPGNPVVPVPPAVLLFGSALALISPVWRRTARTPA